MDPLPPASPPSNSRPVLPPGEFINTPPESDSTSRSAASSAAAGVRSPRPETFTEDFRRFFMRGLAALMPTLITFWLLLKILTFLWESVGMHLIEGLKSMSEALRTSGAVAPPTAVHIQTIWDALPSWLVHVIGVVLAVVLVYVVGLVVGNFIGRTTRRLAGILVMRIPLLRAIYPAVKQVTDFLLADKQDHFKGGHVVAVEPHAKGIWSIGLVTGGGLDALSSAVGNEMVTVFVPSSPTAFSGYVLVVPRDSVVELPMTVEQAMRLLISGGVIVPDSVLHAPEFPEKSGGVRSPGGGHATPGLSYR